MALGTQIKTIRARQGLSQEGLAEALGVTRQAVAKWESDKSAPSTGNLLKLSEVLHTPVEELLGQPSVPTAAVPKPPQKFLRIKGALLVFGGYLLIYLLARLLCLPFEGYSVLGWLTTDDPQALSYLYGWLVHNHLFWYSAALSVLFALLGKIRLSLSTLLGFALGLGSGELLGPVPYPEPFRPDHWGWLIWIVVFLLSIAVGIALERREKKSPKAGAPGQTG